MIKRSYKKLFATMVLFMAVCLISPAIFAQEGQEEGADGGTVTDDGRKMSREAQLALVEAQRRIQTNQEDWAAAREPLIQFLEMPQVDPIPDTVYQMLGQFWYLDEQNEKHIEEANKIFKIAHEAFPADEGFLLNYAITTYDLAGQEEDEDVQRKGFKETAQLFEKYYNLSENKEVKYLEYAAQTYYLAENLEEAKRIYVKMIGLVDPPEDSWLNQTIAICQAMEDIKEEEKYIRLALDYFSVDKKYWRLLANLLLGQAKEDEEFMAGTAALEIATRIELPDKKTEWDTLIGLYNWLGMPLRSAESTRTGFDLIVKEDTEKEQKATEKTQQFAVADAYVRGARVDKAVAYLDSLIAKNPSYLYDLKYKKAVILYEARRNDEALAALDECIAMNARAYDVHYMKAWIAWDEKDWDMAEEAFDSASASKEDNIRLTSKDALDMLAGLEEARTK